MTEKKDKFSITVKSNNKDLYSFMKLVPSRKRRIEKASNKPITSDPINQLARKLHPDKQYMIISEIKDETKSTKTFKLKPDPDSETTELAYFRAGQYLSLKIEVNGIMITRPYSIASSPLDSLKNMYEITIKKKEHGFLTDYIWNNWKVGTKVTSSGPEGFLYYESIRDTKNLVAIGGGSGITPFRSMAKDIIDRDINTKLTIIYGSSDENDIIYYDELKEMEEKNPDKIKIILTLSCDNFSLIGCEQGFITAEVIKKYVDIEKSTFYICGPQVMFTHLDREFEILNIPQKRIRKEAFGDIKDIIKYPNYPQEVAEKTFKAKVYIGNIIKEIPAIATESILVGLERANLKPPSKCRSGECGFCRSLLLSGKVYIAPVGDGRRAADKKFNFIHPCYSFPITDIEIRVPRMFKSITFTALW